MTRSTIARVDDGSQRMRRSMRIVESDANDQHIVLICSFVTHISHSDFVIP